ncbi:hypothetical protein BDF22DRAFT_687103 [Syncephalis plumigaleata]|nr:hypothetical protein BDF22DRAFT_687103 [Syncephalis plumigaleata]
MRKSGFVILALCALNAGGSSDTPNGNVSQAKKQKTGPLVEHPVGDPNAYHKIEFDVNKYGTKPLYWEKKYPRMIYYTTITLGGKREPYYYQRERNFYNYIESLANTQQINDQLTSLILERIDDVELPNRGGGCFAFKYNAQRNPIGTYISARITVQNAALLPKIYAKIILGFKLFDDLGVGINTSDYAKCKVIMFLLVTFVSLTTNYYLAILIDTSGVEPVVQFADFTKVLNKLSLKWLLDIALQNRKYAVWADKIGNHPAQIKLSTQRIVFMLARRRGGKYFNLADVINNNRDYAIISK